MIRLSWGVHWRSWDFDIHKHLFTSKEIKETCQVHISVLNSIFLSLLDRKSEWESQGERGRGTTCPAFQAKGGPRAARAISCLFSAIPTCLHRGTRLHSLFILSSSLFPVFISASGPHRQQQENERRWRCSLSLLSLPAYLRGFIPVVWPCPSLSYCCCPLYRGARVPRPHVYTYSTCMCTRTFTHSNVVWRMHSFPTCIFSHLLYLTLLWENTFRVAWINPSIFTLRKVKGTFLPNLFPGALPHSMNKFTLQRCTSSMVV